MQVLRLQVKYTGKRLPIYFPKGGRNMAASDYTSLVQQFYVGFYGRPADAAGLAYWSERVDFFNGDFTSVLNAFANSAEADEYVYTDPDTGDKYTNTELVENVYQDLFGRAADAAGLEWYVGKLDSGEYTVQDVVKRVIDGAQGDDSTVLANKVKVAEYFTDNLGDATYGADEITDARAVLSGVEADDASVLAALDLADSTIEDMGGGAGETFTLTTGVDYITGTSGNDIVRGTLDGTIVSESTLNALDEIDGAAGTDTLKISTSDTGAIDLPTLSSVEVIEVSGTQDVSIDTSAVADVTDLKVIKAGDDITATAGATTDVDVTVKAANYNDVVVSGGTNVNVKLTDVVDDGAGDENDITIGTGATAPAGDVVVEATAKAAADSVDIDMGDIDITGGKTISVTQNVGDSSALVAGGTSPTHSQGDVTIAAAATTTDVTVKQDATVGPLNGATAVTGVNEVVSVKFEALDATETMVLTDGVNLLTFTASKDLTAAQVAAAFANLSADAVKPASAAGDTQGSQIVANGVFTGALAGWNSGAASDDTVIFTAKTAGTTGLNDGGGNGTAVPTVTTATVTPVVGVEPRLGVNAGVVDITGAAALATVTVDAYSGLSQIQGASNDALDTVNLSNGAAFDIISAAATLDLNLTNVTGAVDVAAGTTTLNAKVETTETTAATLVSASAKTVNVSGTGLVSGTTATGLTAATAINTTGMTAGAATFTIAAGTATSYSGGAGTDSVTVSNANTAITKAIDLGAGNDTLKLDVVGVTTVAVPTATLKGGAGTDTLSMRVEDADALDGNTTFAGKLDSFEQLTLNNAGTGGETINLANLGFTDYVTTTGSAGTLTLNNLDSNGTVVITAAAIGGYTIGVKDAATGEADVANVMISSSGVVNAGVLKVAKVETININSDDTDTTVHANSLILTADKATTLNVEGDAGLTLTALTGSDVLATINASDMTGVLTAEATGKVAMTITGGSANDILTASNGAAAKADTLSGGDGDDTLYAGTNGGTLAGDAGNDLFILGSGAALGGTKEANTYSTITDFETGDLLQLAYWDSAVVAPDVVTSFAKLTASLDSGTAVYSDYVNAAMSQAAATTPGTAGDAVWFNYNNNSYVVVDSNVETTGTFTNGEDLVIKLAGVDLSDASFNADYGTVALV
jgi:hypothetical protein